MKLFRHWWVAAALVFIAIAAPSISAAGPTGRGPDDPLAADGSWQQVPANGSLWYYFDYPGDKSPVEVDLDTNGVPNIGFKILTPDQAKAYVLDPTTTPIGVGTPPGPNTQAANHDLVWQGGFNFSGRIFAVIVNNNANSVGARITITGTNILTGPTPTATPFPDFLKNPFATPVAVGSIQGRLLFQQASGGNIFVVNGDGSGLNRVTSGLDPSWSPDGSKIAFARWNPPAGLYIAAANGANEHGIFQGNQVVSPVWSPDGSRVAFTIQKGGTTEDKLICFRGQCITIPANPHWKIQVINVATGALTEPPCSNHCFSPTWSSDNKTLAYSDAQFGILTTDTTSGTPPSNLFTQNPDVESTIYSPDGSKIAFQVRQADHWDINWINADGSNQTVVTSADPLSFKPVNNVAPTWSPDGKQLLFLSDRNGKWEFFVANLDGTGITQVLKNVTDQMPINYNFSSERVIEWRR